MAPRRKAHNGPAMKRWYADCPNCGEEKEIVMAKIIAQPSYRAPYCRGCSKVLDTKTVMRKR